MMARLTNDLSIPGLICLGRDFTVPDLIAETELPVQIRSATPTDSGALFFNGGTTGLPKVVEHTHGRLIHSLRSVEHMLPPQSDHEVFLAIAPFSHVYGFLMGVLAPISARGETVIAKRFQPEHVVELLERHHVTCFGGGPPAIYAGVLATSNLASADLWALKVCLGGGAPFLTDRKKDVMFVNGFNIFPREVEEVIYTHPKIGMVGVVGVPDARTAGERLAAFVVLRAVETIDEAEILAYCAPRLVNYKCPTEVRVVEQLPTTSVGKLDRVALRKAVSVGQSLPPTLDD